MTESTLVTWTEYAGNRYVVVMPNEEPQWVKNMRADAWPGATQCFDARGLARAK